VRPRRLWYGVAALAMVLGMVGAVVGAVLAATAAGRVSASVAEFDLDLRPVPDDAEATTVLDLTTGTGMAVYAAVTRTGTGTDAVYGPAPAVSCSGAGITVEAGRTDVTTVQDGVAYRPVRVVRAATTGSYRIGCASEDGTATLAVGPELDLGALRQVGTGIMGTVAGVVLALTSAVLGLLVGGAIALVTGLRRAAHRTRTAAAGLSS
jgi:hypothetical protein